MHPLQINGKAPESPENGGFTIYLKPYERGGRMKRAKIDRLCEIRKLNNLSQEAAAELFGVSASYYIKVETGYCKAGRGFIERFRQLFPKEDISIFFDVA